MRRQATRLLLDVLLITSGSALMALAYTLFLIPHRIVPGGAGGVAMILNHFFRTPVGLVIVILNVPLFIIGIRVLGKSYGVKSVLGIIISSGLIDLFGYALPLGKATDNPILACVFGGLLLGGGLGLVFRGGGSTGGSDIIGQLISRRSNLSTGTAILLVDAVIISASGLAFGNFELALYGYLNLYLQTRAIDLVLEGLSYTRAMFIISDSAVGISRAITATMNRGATLLEAEGGHSGKPRQMVFSVMSKREVIRAREIARAIDPRAFIVITDVYEVLGEGFRART
ncbi:YitT family protein [candidate division WOR-3 bacterium]|nr:YitT family protein [candidate division WOR-3 bacterium]